MPTHPGRPTGRTQQGPTTILRRNLHQDSHANRQQAAAEARKAALARFASRPPPDDPAVQARLAEQVNLANAREARRVAQEEAKRLAAEAQAAEEARQAAEAAAEAKRLAAERAAAEAAARAEAEAARLAAEQAAAEAARDALAGAERAAMLDAEKKQRALALLAEQKAARDARYAARKSRK